MLIQFNINCIWIAAYTGLIRLKLTKSRPQTKPCIYFQGLLGVYSEFNKAEPEIISSKPRVNQEWTQRVNPWSEVDPWKETLHVYLE